MLPLLLSSLSFAQNDPIDKVMNKIDFGEDKIESTFKWIAENIKYDLKKLERIKEGEKPKNRSSFKSVEEYEAYLVETVVSQKKGVCEDYSLLFDAIVNRLGYESFVVTGYNKDIKGNVRGNVGHAWNAVKVDEQWKLYDVTWGAGYVENGKYTAKYNPDWYNTSPDVFIEKHMPFDPIWQLLESPLNYEQFNENKAPNTEEKYPFQTLISDYLALGEKEQMQAELARSEEMGEGVKAINRRRKYLAKRIGLFGVVNNKVDLQTTGANVTKSVELYNKYIAAKNKQFKGKRYERETAKQYLLTALPLLESAQVVLNGIDVDDTKARAQISKNKRVVSSLLEKTQRELKWLER